MRDRLLHDALYSLTEDAADLLEGRLAAGEEIPFEVGESGANQTSRRSTALYAYKPLTAEFVASHAEQLRSLESFDTATQHLARTHGAVAYLRGRGEPVLEVSAITHARLAVLAFLSSVWSEAESFSQFEDRFGPAYNELESVVLAARLVTTAYIPVHGVVLEAEDVNLGDGVQLVAADTITEECEARFADEPRAADCYCAVSIDAPSDAPLPVAELRHEARCALTALRLFKPGSVSFGLNAQTEVAGNWRSVAMPFSGRAREEAWRLLDGEDDELRQFMAAVRRVEKRTRTSWALKRFEMGLERTVPAEGLSDFLAAAHSLLEAHDDKGRAALPARIAALCATADERARVATAIENAFALERLAIGGSVGKSDRKRLASSSPLETIGEVERCLRALLHDLICGYLESDLRKLADEILMADGEPVSVEEAIDREAGYATSFFRPADDLGIDTVQGTGTAEFDPVFDDTAEIAAADLRVVPDAERDTEIHTGIDAELDDVPTTAFAAGGDAELAGEIESAEDFIAAEAAATPEAGEADGPADEWTASVLSDDQQWWSPEQSRANFESTRETDGLDALIDAVDQVAEEEAFEQTTQSYEELDASARMNQIAEELVDGFDRSFVETMDDEAGDSSADAEIAARRIDADPEQAARMSFTPPGETDLTFDFPVLAKAMRREAEREQSPPPVEAETEDDERAVRGLSAQERVDFMHKHAGLTGEFPVPEFNVPDRVRHERLRELLGDRPVERQNFNQIMNKSYPVEAPSKAPAKPAPASTEGDHVIPEAKPVDFKRPRLVALNGGATATPAPLEQPPSDPDVTTPALSGPATPAVDALDQATAEVEAIASEPSEPAWSRPDWHTVDQPAVDAEPAGEASDADEPVNESTIDHNEARSASLGPATIEFRPLVDPDLDDPDDFAGAV